MFSFSTEVIAADCADSINHAHHKFRQTPSNVDVFKLLVSKQQPQNYKDKLIFNDMKHRPS